LRGEGVENSNPHPLTILWKFQFSFGVFLYKVLIPPFPFRISSDPTWVGITGYFLGSRDADQE